MKKFIRIYADAVLDINASVNLSKEQAHYLKNVMRKNVGDELLVFNNSYGEYLGEIRNISKSECVLFLKENTKPSKPLNNITLAFAPVKNAKAEYIVEKATELGIGSITPIITERTIIRKVNNERLVKTSIEAAEQCERVNVPQVNKTNSIINLIKSNEKIIFCNERGGAVKLNELQLDANENYNILIGPEGGFSDDEVALLERYENSISVTLGENILRADTAAILACGVVSLLPV